MFMKIYKAIIYGFSFQTIAIILTTIIVVLHSRDIDVLYVGCGLEFINIIFATILFISTWTIESIKLRSISPKKRR